MNIAMWSGPRNISTAMMYSFSSRRDFEVVDEPFYGVYLQETGLKHPMRGDVLESMPLDANAIEKRLKSPGLETHFYQKHMTHHMVDAVPLGWMRDVRNVFLIRHPARVIASYLQKSDHVTSQDIGFDDQFRLFEHVQSIGQNPIVIDASDIRANPEDALRRLCSTLALDWDHAMLSWPKGGNAADGAWASHWYGAVHDSTGFAGPEGELPKLERRHDSLLEPALEIYEMFKSRAI